MKKFNFWVVVAIALMTVQCNPQDATEKTVWIGGAQSPIYAGYAGETTFIVDLHFVTEGQTGTVTWYSNDAGTTPISSPVGITGTMHSYLGSGYHFQASLTFNITASASAGTYYFRVTIDGTQSNVCELVISALVAGITINPTGIVSLGWGQSTTLTATISPANATNKNISWSSDSDDSNIKVNAETGTVTLIGYYLGGEITIRATATDGSGVTATKNITVGRWGQGDGTPGNPYIIVTPEQLDAVRYQMSAHFKLGQNIDLTTYLQSGGEGYAKWGTAGWMPLGGVIVYSSSFFSGNFDGDGFKITGLWSNRLTGDGGGLFNVVSGGNVQNLGVEIAIDGSIRLSGDYVGGIAGYVESSSITSCYVIGSITNSANYVGGVAGMNNGNIVNCYYIGTITGPASFYGGITGSNSGSITNCYTMGSVSNYRYAGGIAGGNSSGNITNCVALNSGVAISYTAAVMNVDVGRVVGYTYLSTLVNNWAHSEMIVTANGIPFGSSAGPENIAGADITPVDAEKTLTWWTTTTNWNTTSPNTEWKFGSDDDNPWKWDATLQRPILYWQ